MLRRLGRGEEQLVLAVLERLVDRVEALGRRRAAALDLGAISAAISISQDLVRDEQPVDGAALG